MEDSTDFFYQVRIDKVNLGLVRIGQIPKRIGPGISLTYGLSHRGFTLYLP